MGNQESISTETYIIKKKVQKQPIQPRQPKQSRNNPLPPQERHIEPSRPPQEKYVEQLPLQERYVEPPKPRQSSNNALVERNLFSEVNIKKSSNIFDYPSNSNNELTIPKQNIDNLEFTPYNFNDEINKFKKNLSSERTEFENKEKERRVMFEKTQKDKSKYLENQISNFEQKYNPWEILGLTYNDYDINNIKKAYKKSALKYHPDRVGDKFKDKFQLITQSYIYLLGKADETNVIEKKINKTVEKADYGDDINENVENIYIDKDNFNINQFNKIFDEYKIPSSFDKGYSNLGKEDIEEQQVFGSKFNSDIFNAHFDNIKTKKNSNELIEYQEPNALDSSNNNMNQTFLGMDDMNDFGSMNNNNLSYTDYKKAHVDENLLINVNKVKYKTYNSIDQLESDRSSISYVATNEDKKRYEYVERKKLEDDRLRTMQQKNYDEMIENQYRKLNQRLIVNKK